MRHESRRRLVAHDFAERGGADPPHLAADAVAVTGNDYTPLNFIDPKTGEAVGWEYDAVNEMCKRLNCQVDWKVSAWIR